MMHLSCRLQVKLLWSGLLKWLVQACQSHCVSQNANPSDNCLPARFTDVKHQAFAAGKAVNNIGRLANDMSTDGKIEFKF